MRRLAKISVQLVAVVTTLSVLGACASRQGRSDYGPSAATPMEGPALVVRPALVAEGVLPAAAAEPRAWVGDEIGLAQERHIAHRHEAAFVYAAAAPSRITVAGRTRTLRPGEAMFVDENVPHSHVPTCEGITDCRDNFWEIRLARPGSKPPAGDDDVKHVFTSPTFTASDAKGTRLRFEVIQLPPGAATSFPTGDDAYLYVKRGHIAYGTTVGAREIRAGQGIPATGVTSRARNDGSEPAELLTWRATH